MYCLVSSARSVWSVAATVYKERVPPGIPMEAASNQVSTELYCWQLQPGVLSVCPGSFGITSASNMPETNAIAVTS